MQTRFAVPSAGARRRVGTTALGAVVAAVLVAACTGPPDDRKGPAPDGTGTTAAPSQDGGDATGTGDDATRTPEPHVASLAAGPVRIEVTAPGVPATETEPDAVDVSPGHEGTSEIRLVLGDEPVTVSVTDGSLARHADGTLGVLDDAGTPVGGLATPRVVGEHDGSPGADAPTVRVALVDAHHAEVSLEPASSTPDASDGTDADQGTVTAYDVVTTLGTQGLRSATWGEREGGRSLAVDPTAWARATGRAGQQLVLAELVATEPEASSATMHDQLVCHAVGAPDKETWNLEPWRPDVGLLATMAARCNPT